MLVAIVRRLPIALVAGLGLFFLSHEAAQATEFLCGTTGLPIQVSSFSFGVATPTTTNVSRIVVKVGTGAPANSPGVSSKPVTCTFTFDKASYPIFNGELVSKLTLDGTVETMFDTVPVSSNKTYAFTAFTKITYSAASTMAPAANPKSTALPPKT